jgi:hypothetical protein
MGLKLYKTNGEIFLDAKKRVYKKCCILFFAVLYYYLSPQESDAHGRASADVVTDVTILIGRHYDNVQVIDLRLKTQPRVA